MIRWFLAADLRDWNCLILYGWSLARCDWCIRVELNIGRKLMTMFRKESSQTAYDYDDVIWPFEFAEGKAIVRYPPLDWDRGIIRAATESGDKDKAHHTGERHVAGVFARDYAGELIKLESEASFLQSQLNVEEAEKARLEETFAREPLEIPAPLENGGADGPAKPNQEIPPGKWLLRDKLTAGSALAGVVGMSFASYFGIQATFAAAELDIVNDYPYLLYGLALVGPCGGLAVKLITNLFNEQRHQDRYRFIISILGVFAFLVWIVLFAWLFEGLSGQFDPFAEVNHLVVWGFNLTQILSEVLIAAALFVQVDLVLRKTSPSGNIPNPARPPLVRAKGEQLFVVADLTARQADVEGRLGQLQGIKEEALVAVSAAIDERMNLQPRETML